MCKTDNDGCQETKGFGSGLTKVGLCKYSGGLRLLGQGQSRRGDGVLYPLSYLINQCLYKSGERQPVLRFVHFQHSQIIVITLRSSNSRSECMRFLFTLPPSGLWRSKSLLRKSDYQCANISRFPRRKKLLS